MLSKEVPEPAQGACQRLFDDLVNHVPDAQELLIWEDAQEKELGTWIDPTSKGLTSSIAEPLEGEFVRQVGSDPAFYPEMCVEAEQIGAKLPERAKEKV
jgi:hypothetical protein